MSLSPRMEGRTGLKVFRLSDVPYEIRMKAAQRCADLEARRAEDPISAVFETLKIEAVARDPELAATTMAEECSNDFRVVPVDEWVKVVGEP